MCVIYCAVLSLIFDEVSFCWKLTAFTVSSYFSLNTRKHVQYRWVYISSCWRMKNACSLKNVCYNKNRLAGFLKHLGKRSPTPFTRCICAQLGFSWSHISGINFWKMISQGFSGQFFVVEYSVDPITLHRKQSVSYQRDSVLFILLSRFPVIEQGWFKKTGNSNASLIKKTLLKLVNHHCRHRLWINSTLSYVKSNESRVHPWF